MGLYLAIVALANIPVVQSYLGHKVADALAQKLNTKVSVGAVNLGLFNRIIIDDVRMLDQQGRDMLLAARISAKIDFAALAQGRTSITSAQLFGLRANLYKATAEAKPNFQFVLDSLASKDTTKHTPLNLELKSLIIRRGIVNYDQLDVPRRRAFDTHHLHLSGLSSHIILNTLRDDSINLSIKRLALKEASGIDIRSLALKFVANKSRAELSDFDLQLPYSELRLGPITATYRFNGKRLYASSLRYQGAILESYANPTDLVGLVPQLAKFTRPVVLAAKFSGTGSSLLIDRFEASVPEAGLSPNLRSARDIHIALKGSVAGLNRVSSWRADIADLMANESGLALLAGNIPPEVARMRSISYRGKASGHGKTIGAEGELHTGVGNARLAMTLRGNEFSGRIETQGINLRQILDDQKFGILATNIDVEGHIARKYYKARGTIRQIDYNDYAYENVKVDGIYNNGMLTGQLHIADPNLAADLNGSLNATPGRLQANLTAHVDHFAPSALRLFSGRLANAVYSGDIVAAFTGNSLNTAKGNLYVTRFTKTTPNSQYALDSLSLQAGNDERGHFLALQSDFAEATVTGRFDYNTLIQSIENAIVKKLPSIQQLTPIKYRPTQANDFALQAVVKRADWLREFFGVPLELPRPLTISGSLDRASDKLEANIQAPSIVYDNAHYTRASVIINSTNERLNADISATKLGAKGIGMEMRVEASAADDQLSSILYIDNHARSKRLRGRLNSTLQFGRNDQGLAEARVGINRSTMSVGDSTFTIHPSHIVYSKNHLLVDGFAVTNGRQHIKANGLVTTDAADQLAVDLNDIDVSYILNLVNFHAVEFSGRASGRAYLSQLFAQPEARANLRVADFRMQDGRMGTLHADVAWNRQQEQIDIDAQALDTMLTAAKVSQPRTTTIKGYVSPKRHYIDLGIDADNTRGEFVGSFCSSFMNRADITANGHVRVWGDLSDINLTGELVASGHVGITPLNTVYTLRNDTIRCLINEIQFPTDTVYDRNGNPAVITGSLYHDHLSRLSFDLSVAAHNFLGYDWGPTYGSTFYGTVYATGRVDIKGKPGEVNIDVDATPEKGSQVVYDVTSPEAIGSQEFIHWTSRDSSGRVLPMPRGPIAAADSTDAVPEPADIPTDIRINFIINTNPEATLKVLMDKTTGDYITLNGSGSLRASYYNKGGVDIFGNYLIDHGVYKLTIQNIIKREFSFAPGGSIVFGGNPTDAALSLKAQYTLNSVSLSDLQIGRSFTGNNIRVNCIMNISGSPTAPRVDFDLDMPTVGTDAKQMIYSLINSEEEMNQQVLYLLAVGRFYAQPTNNAGAPPGTDSQTSLAMQSILSTQISQQLNTVLSSVVKNSNWNLGANISTGDEGWNNAEYEGLLSGRMLNNRLLFDGQFGYRDNKYATTSFIGDFDLRYLIFPNGNLSVHVYNQNNDRYFTRSTLNTQGVGFIIKKDFDSWKSLFRWRKKTKGQ